MRLLVLALALTAVLGQEGPQLTTPRLAERAQRALFTPAETTFRLGVNTLTGTPRVDNIAGLQLQGDKSAFPVLATLPNQGSSFFITTLKPCGIILPHVHPRATEQYVIISGTMGCGLAEENGGRQNITFNATPGQSFIAPQGLLHYNVNRQCTPLVFIQMFNSADAGTVNVIGALAALKAVDNSTIASSSAGGVIASPQNAFALDQQCLAACGLSAANGGGLGGLSAEMQAFVGLAGAPGAAPPTPTIAATVPTMGVSSG